MSLSTSLLWRGVLAVIIGIVSFTWPGLTIGAFAILFAVYAFVAAVLEVVRAFSRERAGPVVGWLLLALLSVAAGVVALAWPGVTALVLTIWIGAWALTTGLLEVALTFRQGQIAGEWAAWILGGLVSIALAVVLFIRPDIGAVSLAEVFGLFSLFYGIIGIVPSVRARRILAAV
ncbi:DUF308 domain-containing protein [Actinoplanes sp. NPDC048796]|uniref:HdeD family acid-resistance protein n=1 Tax=Actinoplanes sp. NPDC048796 TaxID=3155640 RepID=UPI0033C4CE6D